MRGLIIHPHFYISQKLNVNGKKLRYSLINQPNNLIQGEQNKQNKQKYQLPEACIQFVIQEK